MKKLFTFIILSQLCFTSLSYVQDTLNKLEFIENSTLSPSPSPFLLLDLIPYIYNFVNNNDLF
jgi:hypothetical protein